MSKVLFVAVNYRSYDDALCLVECLETAVHPGRFEVVVVDNTEEPEPNHSIFSKARDRNGIMIVGDGCNRGYLGGAAYGLDCYKQCVSQENLDWVIVANCDIETDAHNLLACLDAIAARCECERIGVVAPRIHSTRTGADQNPYYVRAPSARKYRVLSLLFRSYLLALGYRSVAHLMRWVFSKPPVDSMIEDNATGSYRPGAQRIYAGHGSCMMFHRQYFQFGGTLTYEQFLYCEEVFVGATTEQLGLGVLYEPSVVVSHSEHGTIRLWPRRQVIRYLADAHLYAYKNYLRSRGTGSRRALSQRVLATAGGHSQSRAIEMISADAVTRGEVSDKEVD
jgi:GT2 family glycosyltransferase